MPDNDFTYVEPIKSRTITEDPNAAKLTRTWLVNHNDPEAIFMVGMLPLYMEQHPLLPQFYVHDIAIDPPAQDGKKCVVRINYRTWPMGLNPFGEVWVWDIGSRNQNITSVRDSSYCWHSGDEDVGNAIGVDGTQTHGVGVYRPAIQLQVKKLWSVITAADRIFLESMLNTTNAYDWLEYLPGEVLFIGAKIQRRADGLIDVTYNFLISLHQGQQSIEMWNDTYTYIEPHPWDYVWYQYVDLPPDTDSSGEDDPPVKRGVRSVHVAQVYDEADFSMFGLVGPFG